MKTSPFLLLTVLILSMAKLSSAPFMSISPSLIKPRVKGEQTDVGFGVNFRTGYEFLRSDWLLSGHAIEFEAGYNGYTFESGDTALGDFSATAVPLMLNYRYTQYWGSSRANAAGMEYWSPDFILYGGAGLGGVILSAEETHTFLGKVEISEFSPAFQFFFGTGIGFNDRLSLTGGYRHLWMSEIETEGAAAYSYNSSLHIFDLNFRWLW